MINKKSILIVDDDADDRQIIKDAFMAKHEAADYVLIENGERVMQYLTEKEENNLPALILLDLNMAGKDGRTVLKEIKNNTKLQHIPTVILTTSSSKRDKQSVYDLGANCFITKPDTFNKLVDITSSIARLWLMEE